jgi:2,4-dienoyl-CoA reductase-like NADH-dependent reductase (Old Yellow Enzyme family)
MFHLVEPVTPGSVKLTSRAVMAPMAHSRGRGRRHRHRPQRRHRHRPHWRYYAQRASAGLIVSEAVQPGAIGQGYVATLGLHTRGADRKLEEGDRRRARRRRGHFRAAHAFRPDRPPRAAQ